jgi:peptidoglycan glycosyltransferase
MATAAPRRHRFRRFVAPLFIPLGILIILLVVLAWFPVRQAREAWNSGHDAQAITIANRWSQLHLWSNQYAQILAAAYLGAGNRAAAAPYLQPKRLWFSAIDKADVARRLFAREQYGDFLAYDDAFVDRNRNPEAALYRGAAEVASGHPDAFAALPPSSDAHYQWLKRVVSGQMPAVLDRAGNAIVVTLPKFNTNDTIETTLDPLVQQAALAALGKYRGSLVAIDPRTNDILAIASSVSEDLAIERQYEPGSVIKVLTGLNAITNGVDVNAMFPYTCKGELMIDGRHFGDWMPQGHGTLKSLDDALAVSCNVFFADVGIRLKREGLERFMTAAGFNGTAKLGVFEAPLGRITGEIFNNFETAFLAIGLQHETINTLHLAMLASMVANRGMYATPRLMRDRRSIVGDVVMTMPAPSAVRIASDDAARRVIHAMQAVASDPRGTGRRAPVEGISMAMKTGTAGERKSGLEALIMAFAPVESPRIAFAVIAEDAGPAEFAGAKIAHDFLEKMKPALK